MSPIAYSPITFRTILIYGFGLLCLLGFLVYVIFQARFLLAGPQIFVSPNPSVSEERMVTIAGQAKNIVRITLNGRQIFTDKNGNFNEALVLENGYTVATLRAEDRYGRVTQHTQSYVLSQEEETDDVVINQ